MKQLLEAVRAAMKQPQRVLACLRACHGVDIEVIEAHDHDYSLGHLVDQLQAATIMSQQDDRRLQQLVAERNLLAASLQGLIRGYVSTMENGRDRILMLGGQCDPVDVMEASDPNLREAKAALQRFMQPQPTVQVVGVDTGEEH